MKQLKNTLIICTVALFLTSSLAWAGQTKVLKKPVLPDLKVGFNPQPEPPGKAVIKPSLSNPLMQKATGGDNGVGEHVMTGGGNGVGEKAITRLGKKF